MKYVTIDFRIEKNNPKYLVRTSQNQHLFAESYKNKLNYFRAKLGNDYIEAEPTTVFTECPFCDSTYNDINPVTYSADKSKRILESYCPKCNKFAFVYQELLHTDYEDT